MDIATWELIPAAVVATVLALVVTILSSRERPATLPSMTGT